LFVREHELKRDVSDARKQERFSVRNACNGICPQGIRAEALQGALDGGDVASAVVDDGYFHSMPFVLGRTLRKRLSRATAKRSARAKALNMAST